MIIPVITITRQYKHLVVYAFLDGVLVKENPKEKAIDYLIIFNAKHSQSGIKLFWSNGFW